MNTLKMTANYFTLVILLFVFCGFCVAADECPVNVTEACTCEILNGLMNIGCYYLDNNNTSPIIVDSSDNATRSYRINTVKISSNNISSLPKNYFQHIYSISLLDMQNNSFAEIPTEVFTIPTVSILQISNNRLKLLNLSSFATESIKELSCSHNDLEIVYVDDSSVSLKSLDISWNNLRTVPIELWSVASYLNLSNNMLGFVPILPQSKLEILNLNSNSINSIEVQAFNNVPFLDELHLVDNQIATLVPETFEGLDSLTELHLADNRLQDLNENLFRSLKSLIILELSKNNLTNLKMETFVGLEQNLQELNLSRNNLAFLVANDTFENLENLRMLDLSYNKGIKDIGHLMFPPHLASLSVKNCSLTTIGGCRFLKMKDIQNLDISGNEFTCSCGLSLLHAWYRARQRHGYSELIHYHFNEWFCKNVTDGKIYAVTDNEHECGRYQSIEDHCDIAEEDPLPLAIKLDVKLLDNQISVVWDVKGDSSFIFGFVVSLKSTGKETYKTPILEKTQSSFIVTKSEDESEIDVCVNVLSNKTSVVAMACQSVSSSSLDYVIGILAGVVFLIPCIAALIFILRKDRMMQRLEYSQIAEPKDKAAYQVETGPVVVVDSEILDVDTAVSPYHENKAFDAHLEENIKQNITEENITVTVDISDPPEISEVSQSENTQL
ncbi:TLR4 interactor with leucine rich repeats [Patella vulgata]|uniref:TLR4 interactor with leucine rich repeats n=1 Tax=Patella vulgata TaxID=6465 RepID=UPI00217F3279|nr:TLR4 interactor with leucine rich repeats [Patella vulgata]XP_050403557.1 TLR4 interactor with leucine rich repeats [Patella vulgata]XP_050403566.1 TLR4 interactor with leucine rich repeats [Patella vulgata]XP_050403573.1 TLR4 interactor with leucine rich repeats [Patella vulgata]